MSEATAEVAESTPSEPAATTTKPPRWRRVTVSLLVVISCVLAPLSVTAIWVRRQILSTSHYVATVKPLASNPAIQQAVATNITDTLFKNVDVKTIAENALPARADFLAGPLTTGLEQFVQRAALTFIQSDQFQKLWVLANQHAHNQVQKALTGGGKVISTANGHVTIDLSQVALQIRHELDNRGIHVFDSIPINRITTKYELWNSEQLKKAQRAVRLLNTVSYALPVLMLLCLGGALYLSSHRRKTLTHWGVGVAIALSVLAAGLAVGRSIYLDKVVSPQLPHDAAAAAFDTIVHYLRLSLRLVLAIALIIALAAWITGPTHFATRIRGATQRAIDGAGAKAGEEGVGFGGVGQVVLQHRAGFRIGGVLVALIALLLWNHPRATVVVFLTILLLIYLALVEFVSRASMAASTHQPVAAGQS
jgi:hypothetical protein